MISNAMNKLSANQEMYNSDEERDLYDNSMNSIRASPAGSGF